MIGWDGWMETKERQCNLHEPYSYNENYGARDFPEIPAWERAG